MSSFNCYKESEGIIYNIENIPKKGVEMINLIHLRKSKENFRNKSQHTLLHYFFSYFLIFSVLILGFFYIMRSQLTSLYYKQLTAQSQEQLTHVVRQLKDEINSLDAIKSAMQGNPNMNPYLYKNDASYQYMVYLEILQYTTGKPFIDSIIYANMEPDFVISSYQPVDYKNSVFYLHSNLSNQNTLLFDSANYMGATRNQLISLKDDATNYIIYFPVHYDRSRYVSFFIVDTAEIEQMCNNIVSDAMPAVALVDNNRQIVCGVNTDMLENYMDYFDYDTGIYPLDNNNSVCVATGITDSFVMLSLISNDALLDQVSTAFSRSYIILLGLGCIGMLLVFFATRSTFMPLSRLTKKVVANPDPSQSYFDQLDQAFEDSVRQKQNLQEKLDKYKLSMQKSILDSIVSSNQPADAASLPDIDQFFNMDPNNYIFAVRMRAPQSPFPCNEILTFFRNSLSPEDSCVILETQQDTAIFLLNYSGTEQHKDEVLHLLLMDLYRERGYLSAISNSSSSPMDIPSLYEHSILASKFWEHTPIVCYYDVASKTHTNPTLTYPYDTLSNLSSSLRENNCKDAAAHVNELFRIIDMSIASGNNLPDFFVRSILFDLLTTIVNAMNDKNIRFKAYSDLYFETLYYCRSFPYEQNRETIQKNIDQMLSFLERQLDNKITNSYQLRQIMEEYYTQPDFSITVLADKFQVSIAYMSYLIKKETNQTFSDYLWELRLRKAKEMLLNTSQSVDEISLAVGYANTSSFRRKFKQETGLTPSQFRSGETCQN